MTPKFCFILTATVFVYTLSAHAAASPRLGVKPKKYGAPVTPIPRTNDEFLTHRDSVEPVVRQIAARHPDLTERAKIVIWDGCAARPESYEKYGNEIINCAKAYGFKTRLTGIHKGLPKKDQFDFLSRDEVPFDYHYCVTNVPFSTQRHFRNACRARGKPFALLIGGFGNERIQRYIDGPRSQKNWYDVLTMNPTEDCTYVKFKDPLKQVNRTYKDNGERIFEPATSWRSIWLCKSGAILERHTMNCDEAMKVKVKRSPAQFTSLTCAHCRIICNSGKQLRLHQKKHCKMLPRSRKPACGNAKKLPREGTPRCPETSGKASRSTPGEEGQSASLGLEEYKRWANSVWGKLGTFEKDQKYYGAIKMREDGSLFYRPPHGKRMPGCDAKHGIDTEEPPSSSPSFRECSDSDGGTPEKEYYQPPTKRVNCEGQPRPEEQLNDAALKGSGTHETDRQKWNRLVGNMIAIPPWLDGSKQQNAYRPDQQPMTRTLLFCV